MGREKNKTIVVSGNGNNIATGPNGTTITTSDGNSVTADAKDSIVIINGRVFVDGREI